MAERTSSAGNSRSVLGGAGLVICLAMQDTLRDTRDMATEHDRPDTRKGSIDRELRRGSLELIVLHLLEPG